MALVDDVRRMAGASKNDYTLDNVTYWDDAAVQKLLDANAIRQQASVVLYAVSPGGAVLEGAIMVNGVIDPADETTRGKITDRRGNEVTFTLDKGDSITFDEDQRGQLLTWTGYTYDLAAAAADLCEAWAGQVKLHYDVDAEGQGMSRSQKFEHLTQLAADLRKRSLPQSIPTG